MEQELLWHQVAVMSCAGDLWCLCKLVQIDFLKAEGISVG